MEFERPTLDLWRALKSIALAVGVVVFLAACGLPNNLNPLGKIIDATGGNSGPTATPTSPFKGLNYAQSMTATAEHK